MMADFELSLKSGNAAFADDPAGEVSRILRETADKIDGGDDGGPVRDINGNRVGDWFFDRGDDDGESE